MKNFILTFFILFQVLQVHSQTNVTIVNNSPNTVLMELGWNDSFVPPFFTSFKSHVPDFKCLAPASTANFTAAPNWDILKGFKVWCPFGACTAAQTYTDGGPWSGDPGVAPIWHMGFLQPTGTINYYDCGSGTWLGVVNWTFVSTGCPFPYGDFVITVN